MPAPVPIPAPVPMPAPVPIPAPVPMPMPVKISTPVPSPTPSPKSVFAPIQEPEVDSKENNVVQSKLPKKSLSKLEVGTVEVGLDNKTKYVVQLNKVGRKFWKKV